MIVVADASPLIVLTSIGRVGILPDLFQRLVIPVEVAFELASAKRPQAVQDLIATPLDWLEFQTVTTTERTAGLDAGEAAAIELADELRADRVILDEAAGRKAAGKRNLKVIGTIGVLIAAAERGLIDLGQEFEKVKQTDFWVSPKFLDEQLAAFRARAPGP